MIDSNASEKAIAERTADRFFDICLLNYQQQYQALVNVQTRIQQAFSVSAVIVGILAAFLSSQDDARAIDTILGAVVAVIFLRIAWLYQESQRTRPWKVPDATSISKQMDGKSVAWLGRQMMYRYDDNAKAQDQVASILNASTWTMMVMVFVAVLYLVMRPLLFAQTPATP